MSVLSVPRYMARKYCEFSGATIALAEPYFIATFIAGAATWPESIREKTVDDTANLFRSLLTDLTADAFRGRVQVGTMTGRMQELVSELGLEAYLEGMREGGVDAPEVELDRDDEKAISDWVKEQNAHIGGYVTDAIEAGDDEAKRDAIRARLTMWVNSLGSIGAQGRMSAQANRMGTWRYGDTEHCSTCLSLHGKRHRVKWFLSRGYVPRKPGNEELECRGYNCQCGIYADDGEQLA